MNPCPAWETDSSLEKWFPFTAEELARLKELNEDKFKTIEAYCRAASLDKWRVDRLVRAIDQYLSLDGYRDASRLLTEARADAVNASVSPLPRPKVTGDYWFRCETCQNEATVHIDVIGMHFCADCIKKIDARIAEINTTP